MLNIVQEHKKKQEKNENEPNKHRTLFLGVKHNQQKQGNIVKKNTIKEKTFSVDRSWMARRENLLQQAPFSSVEPSHQASTPLIC